MFSSPSSGRNLEQVPPYESKLAPRRVMGMNRANKGLIELRRRNNKHLSPASWNESKPNTERRAPFRALTGRGPIGARNLLWAHPDHKRRGGVIGGCIGLDSAHHVGW